MKGLLKWILAGLVLLVALAVAAAVALVALVDPNDYKDEIAAKVEQQTGRELHIDGDIGYSFFPWLGFELGAVELGNAPGFDKQPFASIKSADARVKLLPLLRMKVEMDTITLHGLALRLERKADGRTNWDDLVAGGKAEAKAAPEKKAEAAPAKSPEELLGALAINGIEIQDANVLWLDGQSKQRLELKNFALTSGAITLAEPIPLQLSGEVSVAQPQLAGSFALSTHIGLDLEQERYRLDTTVLKADLSGEAIPGGKLKAEIQLNAMADLKQQLAELTGLKLSALGSVLTGEVNVTHLMEQPAAKGHLALTINDGQAATAPIASSLPEGFKREALNGTSLKSNFQVDLGKQSMSLAPLNLAVSGLDLRVDVTGSSIIDNPRFQGTMKSGEFVPRQMLSQLGIELPEMADPSTLTKASLSSNFDAGLDHATLEKLLVKFDQSTLKGRASIKDFASPVIRYDLQLDDINADRYMSPPTEEPADKGGKAAEANAVSAPIALPLELLRSLDIDGRLRIGKVKVMNLTSEVIDTTLTANDGRFRLHPLSAKLYSGGYSGDLRMDVTEDTPKLAMDEKLSGVQAGPLLKDFLGKDYVTGAANLAAKMTAEGIDSLSIRKSLNGSGNFHFDNGQIKGLNIGQRIREAYALYKRQPKPAEEVKQTDFSRLEGSFIVKNGLVTTNDLSARSTLFQVDGKGSVNLVKEKLDLRLDTKIVSDIRDATGERTGEMTGEVIPVTIKGSFSEPDIGVDVASVLKAKARAVIDKKKQEVKQKLEEKKTEAEDKAKQRVEEEKKKLQKGVEDKLKNMLKF